MQAVITQPTAELGYGQSAIKVLLADDHPLIIAGIRRTIEHLDDIDVVGEAHSGAELMQLIGRRAPDTVLMDLNMPGHQRAVGDRPDRLTCAPSIPRSRSWCSRPATIGRRSTPRCTPGASAYVLKSAQTVDIAAVVRQASSGAVFHAPSYAAAPTGAPAEPAGPALTDRERSILAAVASGKTTAAISRDLWISEHTIKFHLTNIYRKLGVANRAGAVRYALEHGIG